MQINIDDLEVINVISNELMKVETKIEDIIFGAGSQIIVNNANGYTIGTLVFDGDFWTFNPEGYGKTLDD